MHILGINAYHAGASACLIQGGRLVTAVEEERFNRLKYWAGFPKHAIRHCLDEAGFDPKDLDHIAISRHPRANLHRKAFFALRRRPNIKYLYDRVRNLRRVGALPEVFASAVGTEPKTLSARFHHVEHHRAHLASAFFVSPFAEAGVLSVDGMGDFSSTMWGLGRDNRITVNGAIRFPHSLGYFYTMVSQWLGFPDYGDEGKVMGLAPYGKLTYLEEMRDVVRIRRDGTFRLNLSYFNHHTDGVEMTWQDGTPVIGPMYGRSFTKRFGPPRDPEREELTDHHRDVAASLQARLEEAIVALLEKLHRDTRLTNLCLAGGVAMNSVMNGKLTDVSPFENVYIQPAAGDAGTALGAAFWVHNQILNNPRTFVMDSPYTGPAFTNGTTRSAIDAAGLECEHLEEDALIARVASLLAEGKVVGWFQGRMEWGARALGARSILADPRREDMKDILNARIKRREAFRPFAPSILEEHLHEYFDGARPDPFMLTVQPVIPNRRSAIPAVTHVDGTSRIQTVDRNSNPRYWKLIKAFHDLTGVPVILNTSFNENEPIVCRPEEAVDCFRRTKMDGLAIGNYLLLK